MGDKLREWMVEYFPAEKAESPVEQLLWAGWQMMLPRMMLSRDDVKAKPQVEVGKYRADFLFTVKTEGGDTKQLVVEVDGHDFHERTKAQAARDRSRDRWMAEHGYDVMRFTGSEVYANPCACALEVADRLYMLRFGQSRREAQARAGLESIRRMLEEG